MKFKLLDVCFLSFLATLILGCSHGVKKNTAHRECLYQENFPSMGSVLKIRFVNNCRSDLTETQVLIQKTLDHWDSSASLYQSSSEISHLNRDGYLSESSPVFKNFLIRSMYHAKKTYGSYDPTVAPLLQAIKESLFKKKHPPSRQKIGHLKSLIGYQNIQLIKNNINFLRPRMALTLDGIVKGMAVDEVARLLEEKNIFRYLIEFSGNIRRKGNSLNQQVWKIEHRHPLTNHKEALPNGNFSMASSSAQYVHYSKDHLWHHLIDPNTGRPAHFWKQVTVLGPLAEICDVLSTALFVSDLEKTRQILKNYPEYQARFY